MPLTVLREHDTCWRIVHARRLAFLIDADAYFGALGAALDNARRSVRVLAWDFDGRLSFRNKVRGLPSRLSKLLVALARRGVRTDVLVWRYPWILLLQRQWFASWRLRFRSRRLRVRLDGRIARGASHHQKIVVVDEKLAFTGGIDLALNRWDRPRHKPRDPERVSEIGEAYEPWHDLMVMVDGEAAGAFSEVVEQRWELYGKRLEDGSAPGSDPWPEGVMPDLEDARVGIARTEPRLGIREVERLHLAAIASARRWIYVENQYLSSRILRDALVARLAEPDGPEIVLVAPSRLSWWFERLSMDVLRARWVRHLQERDPYDRLRVFGPKVGPAPGTPVEVHSKLLIADDALAMIGSANFAERSMGLDTECTLALEAGGVPRVEAAIAGLLYRLLGEHLGCGAARIREAHAREQGLIAAIDAENGGSKRLERIGCDLPGWLDALVPRSELLDPDEPPRFWQWARVLVLGGPMRAVGRALWRVVRDLWSGRAMAPGYLRTTGCR